MNYRNISKKKYSFNYYTNGLPNQCKLQAVITHHLHNICNKIPYKSMEWINIFIN